MSNKIGFLVFAEYFDRDICLRKANNAWNIASVARLDVQIYVTVVFICDDRL